MQSSTPPPNNQQPNSDPSMGKDPNVGNVQIVLPGGGFQPPKVESVKVDANKIPIDKERAWKFSQALGFPVLLNDWGWMFAVWIQAGVVAMGIAHTPWLWTSETLGIAIALLMIFGLWFVYTWQTYPSLRDPLLFRLICFAIGVTGAFMTCTPQK